MLTSFLPFAGSARCLSSLWGTDLAAVCGRIAARLPGHKADPCGRGCRCILQVTLSSLELKWLTA